MRRTATMRAVSIGTDVAEARQGRAIGAQQEDRLDQIAARLLDRQRRELAVVERAFGHHAVDRQAELLVDLLERELRHGAVAAPFLGEQPSALAMAVSPPLTATYMSASTAMLRGSAQQLRAGGEDEIDAAGEQRLVGAPMRARSRRAGRRRRRSPHLDAGAAPSAGRADASAGTSMTRVVERSG